MSWEDDQYWHEQRRKDATDAVMIIWWGALIATGIAAVKTLIEWVMPWLSS